MNKTLKLEIKIEIDKGNVNDVLDKVRSKVIEIDDIEGVRLVTVWEYHKGRGIWLTYGWGVDDHKTQIWVPLKQYGK